MKKLFIKAIMYFFLILLCLEVLVRVFHLYSELPIEEVASDGIVKWIPNQKGISVYGNRKQQVAEYNINNSGYNSYREFKPTKNNFELAFLGDSYIEGFHQNYYNSIGKKIEDKLSNIHVYEFGHSANDFADQMYLLHQNKDLFELIDHVIIRIKYEKDFIRGDYEFYEKKPLFPLFRHSKLVVYLLNIGATKSLKKLYRGVMDLKNVVSKKELKPSTNKGSSKKDVHHLYLENFKKIITKYGFDKSKITLLLDSKKTDLLFVNYLNQTQINYIDYSITFDRENSKPQTLIYDAHWNDYGRELISDDIAKYIFDIQNKNSDRE
ncbi:MAG: hypothetical protein ABJK28_07535 [Algibacter sp.]